MRLRLAARPDGLLSAVKAAAPAATFAAGELVVPGPASIRPRVLDVVRGLGIEVRGLTAEEGRLDVLYRELVAEAPPGAHA
jgi:Cu-processing system ATP-binding protein